MDNDNEVKVGSIVSLKSGGPSMTVGSVSTDGYAACVWSGGPTAPMNERQFHVSTLTVNEQGANAYDFTATADPAPMQASNGLGSGHSPAQQITYGASQSTAFDYPGVSGEPVPAHQRPEEVLSAAAE